MKPGDEYNCPHCGKNSFLKKETLMDGWTKKGDVLKCASCGHLVCSLDPKTAEKNADPLASPSAARLKNLLGEDHFAEKPKITAGEGEQRFCKDCAFLIPHPFVLRCTRTNRTVNPMDDCPDFQRRKQ